MQQGLIYDYMGLIHGLGPYHWIVWSQTMQQGLIYNDMGLVHGLGPYHRIVWS